MTPGTVARLLELRLFEVDDANRMMLSASIQGHGLGFDAVTYCAWKPVASPHVTFREGEAKNPDSGSISRPRTDHGAFAENRPKPASATKSQ
jgi:hypothetical protein